MKATVTVEYKLAKESYRSAMMAAQIEGCLARRYPSMGFSFLPKDDSRDTLFVLTIQSEKKLTQVHLNEMLFYISGLIDMAKAVIK